MNILQAREARAKIIDGYISGFPVIVGTANIPGFDKNIGAARFLVDYFGKYCSAAFPVRKIEHYHNSDGPFFILVSDWDNRLKEKLINIEDGHPLGRLIDLDLHLEKGKAVSRTKLGQTRRKCLLCARDGVLCVRAGAHSYNEIIDKIELTIVSFLKKEILTLVDWAVTAEAALDPKFGLVTIKSQGSHPDMDYNLLMKAKRAILGPLMSIFATGYLKNNNHALRSARALGLEAEKAMFAATDGVNAYKGLIFVLGFTLLALGRCFKEFSFDLFTKVAFFGSNLMNEFTDTATFGKWAYQKYKISGARGEVYSGLPNVIKALPLLQDYSDSSVTMTLISLISNVDDTVLLKRSGSLEAYDNYRKMIGSIKEYNIQTINKITEFCLRRNLSFGGAADLLVVALLIKKIEEKFKYSYEK
ncbi:MAG: triphosphoribosyl-dephospho-CoA synthase [Bacilli bacterium]|nr:triphosphoribosyl-dephospho-CoA synthase [Bacilli bacterium]MDD4077826.1 triphosphoribosyl-dephospho-CoA synthase [Bacilli bacterium]MDD4388703.1 triphosphoribosyl-dephospho-CoA synthase [Bacilli bacterium]